MAIGTTAAIIGSAVIGAGASYLGSRSQSRAAERASNAEVAMARENNALAREFRQQNQANFQPWLNSGGRANALVDSFLFGPSAGPAPTIGAVTPQPATGGTVGGGSTPQPSPLTSGQGLIRPALQNGGEEAFLAQRTTRNGVPIPQAGAVTTSAPSGQNAMMNGYQAFVNSPYYQHPLQEGIKSLNQGYAAGGMLQSGDAMKGITKFGQDHAAGWMGEFIGLAERQSDRGMNAAGGIAGVGMNALGSMTANNNNIGASQAARYAAQGAANANMWGNIGNVLGSAIGGLGGSSYRGY